MGQVVRSLAIIITSRRKCSGILLSTTVLLKQNSMAKWVSNVAKGSRSSADVDRYGSIDLCSSPFALPARDHFPTVNSNSPSVSTVAIHR
jgi:hypothetical protein